MPNDFWNRIRRLYQPAQPSAPTGPVPSPQQQAPQPTTQQTGPLDLQTKIDLIHQAGRQLRLLDIKYDGVWRLVEPYSFRSGRNGLLFYGHCNIHDRTHSFKPEKIEAITVTDIPFSPRWDVEL